MGRRQHSAAPSDPRLTGRRWAATRDAVLDRDGHRCTWHYPDHARCPVRQGLGVHHLVPARHLRGDAFYDHDNLASLCRTHHAALDARLRRQERQRRAAPPPPAWPAAPPRPPAAGGSRT